MSISARGSSLMGVMIAAVILAFIGAATVRLVSNVQKSAKFSETFTDRIAIKTMLIDRVNCRNTLDGSPSGNCSGTGSVSLLAADGAKVIPASGRMLGNWRVQANCLNGNGIEVVATQPFNSTFRKEAVSGLLFDDKHPKAKIFAGNPLCGASLSGQGPVTLSTCPKDGEFLKGFDKLGEPVCTPLVSSTCFWVGPTGITSVNLNDVYAGASPGDDSCFCPNNSLLKGQDMYHHSKGYYAACYCCMLN